MIFDIGSLVKKRILIFTEGGLKNGFGHLNRCVALSQGIAAVKAKSKREIGVIVNGDKAAQRFLSDHKVNPIMLNWIKKRKEALVLAMGADLVIIDSYLAPVAVYYSLYRFSFGQKKRPRKYFVAIDDYNRIEYYVDAVINPSIYGDKISYRRYLRRSSYSKVLYLTGKDYIILRKEFWSVPKKKIRKEIKDVLITFGGITQIRFIKKTLMFLSREFTDFNYHVVLAGRKTFSFLPVKGDSSAPIHWYSNLSAGEMKSLMLKCDIAISGGGQTLYELARIGLPTIAFCFADNQRDNLKSFVNQEFLKYAGWVYDKNSLYKVKDFINEMKYENRMAMCRCGRECVDGKGTGRISKYLLSEKA